MTEKRCNALGFYALSLFMVVIGMGAGCSQDQGATPQQQAPVSQPSSQQPASPNATAAPGNFQTNPQNTAQVQIGMTSQQVQQILGNPGRSKQEKGKIEWEYYTQQGKFEVYFQNDRVVSISRH